MLSRFRMVFRNGEAISLLSPSPKQHNAGTEAVEFNGMLKFERPSLVSRKMAQQWILRRLEVLGLMEVKDSSHAADGKRWPNDVDFMDFTDGLEMFPYFFLKNQTVMFSWS